MQTLKTSLFYTGLFLQCAVSAALAQGTFQNLNFESANVTGYPVGSSTVPISSALPGWTGPSLIWYDTLSLGGALVSINDTNTGFGFVPIQGRYSAYLFSQGLNSPTSVTISQTGLVPGGTMSLQAKMAWFGAAPVVKLGGQTINMVPLQTFPDYVLYGGDIPPSLAGQVALLSFTEPPPAQSSPGGLLLDSIIFSPQQIPEPSGLALSGLGAFLLGFFRRRNSSP